MASGQPVRPETASVVLEAGRWLTGRAPSTWEVDDLAALAWYGIVAWCLSVERVVPDDAGDTLEALAAHLDQTGERGLVDTVTRVVDPVGVAAAHRAVHSA